MTGAKRGVITLLAAASALAFVGCSSDSGSGSGDSSTVELAVLADISGAAAFCGAEVRDAAEAAVEKANEDGMLGDVTIELVEHDTGSNPQEAAAAMSKIASSDAVATIFGCASGVAVGAAPIAQDEGVPFVAMQAGTSGIVDQGDYIFRTTPPQSTFQSKQVDYWVEQDVKDVVVVYQKDNPTLVELAEEVYPPLLDDAGIELMDSHTFAADTVDFSGIAADVAKASPDAVLVHGQGTPNVTFLTQLLQAGYDGEIGGSAGFSGSVLESLGADADGVTYPTDFHPEAPLESTQAFVEAYTEITGTPREDVTQFMAETWDATMFAIEAIAEADSQDREDVRDALQELADAGYEGAVGPLTFEERSAQIEGLLVKRQGGTFQVVDQS